jgi:hypothetical protein
MTTCSDEDKHSTKKYMNLQDISLEDRYPKHSTKRDIPQERYTWVKISFFSLFGTNS